MEMLMARAEQERGALERELRAMRGNASEAASHLHIAQAELRVGLLSAFASIPCLAKVPDQKHAVYVKLCFGGASADSALRVSCRGSRSVGVWRSPPRRRRTARACPCPALSSRPSRAPWASCRRWRAQTAQFPVRAPTRTVFRLQTLDAPTQAAHHWQRQYQLQSACISKCSNRRLMTAV